MDCRHGIARLIALTVTPLILSVATGCATFVKHDQHPVATDYRVAKPLPIKAVEVRFRGKAMGVNTDTDTGRPVSAPFKVTYADGKSDEGVITEDQHIHYGQVAMSAPDRQGRQYLTPDPESFNQQLQAEHNADEALALSILAQKGTDALLAPGRYQSLKARNRAEIRSFDMDVLYPQVVGQEVNNVWATSMREQLVRTGATTSAPPIILTLNERNRIASFIAKLHQDFPGATVRVPPFYTAMQDYLNGLAAADYVLHLDVLHTPNRNMGLIIGNGVLSGLTLWLIPFSIPQQFAVDASLLDKTGKTAATVHSRATMSLILGIPMVFFSCSDEHSMFKGPALLAGEESRIVLKQLAEKRPE